MYDIKSAFIETVEVKRGDDDFENNVISIINV